MFQSTLLFPEGDAGAASIEPPKLDSFNPRLLFPEGDARQQLPGGEGSKSFNPRLLFPEGDAFFNSYRTFQNSFNPRLLFPEGDARRVLCRAAQGAGFNPRLLFPEGDAIARRDGQPIVWPVSIHASCFQKAKHGIATRTGVEAKFQSTPPVSRRRCRRRSVLCCPSARFNPRLLFPEGDAYGVFSGDDPGTLFQSTPPVSRRRCLLKKPHPASSAAFQSTPPVSRRRCLRCWRSPQCGQGFNPRLLFPEGDAGCQLGDEAVLHVSIHASCFQRRCLASVRMRACLSSFNPRLLFPEGDAIPWPPALLLRSGFNPRLLFPEGDAGAASIEPPKLDSFNPRLLFPEGDAPCRQENLKTKL